MDTPFKSNRSSEELDQAAEHMELVLNGIMPGWRDNASTCDTHRRFIKYLAEFSQPMDMSKIFDSTFQLDDGHHSMVMQAPIPFRMICEHHLLPATGKAAIGYVPHKRVLGLSKFTRLVQSVGTEKPSLQEHIADRIKDLLEVHLEPKGIMVIIKATHGCMACRGVNSPGVVTTSSVVSGVFRDNESARQEMLSLIQTEMKMGV